jgi:predicted kinase
VAAVADGVLLLTGAPASGKTTAARLIATTPTLGAHVEADSFFGFVRGGYVQPWLPESYRQNAIVMQAVAAAAAAYAGGGYTTVVDGIITPRWFLAPLAEALAAAGHAVSYAILRPTLATYIARAAARSGDELHNPDVITQLWHQFADVNELERHVIEADSLRPSRSPRPWPADGGPRCCACECTRVPHGAYRTPRSGSPLTRAPVLSENRPPLGPASPFV